MNVGKKKFDFKNRARCGKAKHWFVMVTRYLFYGHINASKKRHTLKLNTNDVD